MGANRFAMLVCALMLLGLSGCGESNPDLLSSDGNDYSGSSSNSSGGYNSGRKYRAKSYTPKKKSRQVTKPTGPEKHGGFSGMVGDTYDTAKSSCKVFGVAKVAKDLHMSSAEPVNVAQKFSDGYWGRHTQAAFEGCLAGFGY